MKILFLTSRLPFPPVGGDKLRTFNFIKYLKKKYQLTLISFIESERELNTIPHFNQYFDKLITIKLPKSVSYGNSLKGLLTSKPLQIHYYFSKKMKKAVQKELEEGYDVIFCHLIRMAQYLPNNMQINKVIDFTDAISLNYIRSKEYRRGIFSIINRIESERVLKYELEAIDRADISIFISPIDADFLRNEGNSTKIKVIANGVDFEKLKFYNGEYDETQVSFVGNMRTFPNTDAVLYFARKIFPLLARAKPEIKFYVVGTEPDQDVLKLDDGESIIVTGYVDSVAPYIVNSAVLVAPMRVGAGVQNKILEAMALGTPVVTTTIGAEGLDESKLTVADSPESIANQILNLIENKTLRKEKALLARKYIESEFHWDAALKDICNFIERA
jgi:sugar transferase (PEP-CTERM/EpsH1 system associated)